MRFLSNSWIEYFSFLENPSLKRPLFRRLRCERKRRTFSRSFRCEIRKGQSIGDLEVRSVYTDVVDSFESFRDKHSSTLLGRGRSRVRRTFICPIFFIFFSAGFRSVNVKYLSLDNQKGWISEITIRRIESRSEAECKLVLLISFFFKVNRPGSTLLQIFIQSTLPATR